MIKYLQGEYLQWSAYTAVCLGSSETSYWYGNAFSYTETQNLSLTVLNPVFIVVDEASMLTTDVYIWEGISQQAHAAERMLRYDWLFCAFHFHPRPLFRALSTMLSKPCCSYTTQKS